MTSPSAQDLRRLLLGQLPAADAERLEAAILMEDGVAPRLREEELDLFDDYVKGRLAPADRAALDRQLSQSAERQLSVRIAAALAAQKAVSTPPLPVRGALRNWRGRRVLLPITTVLAAGLAAVLVIPRWHTGDAGLSGPIPAPVAARTADQTLLLMIDTARGSAPAVHLTLTGKSVRLQAEVPISPGNPRYSLSVADGTGTLVFTQSALAVRAAGPYHYIEVTLPTQVLGLGTRTVTVRVEGPLASTTPGLSWQVETGR